MAKLLQIPIFLCYAVATVCLGVLVLIGWLLINLYDLKGWPDEPDTGNCWSFAVPLWLEEPKSTYLVISMSRYAPVPHVRFAESISNLEVVEFKPRRPRKGWRGIADSFWFRGRIRKGRGEE